MADNPASPEAFENVEKSMEAGQAVPESMPMAGAEKQEVRETSVAEKEAAYGKILEKVQQAAPGKKATPAKDLKADTMQVMAEQDAQVRVQKLVNIALDKGVVYAVEIAKNVQQEMGKYYLIDSVRDTLADDFYESLKEKNLI